MLETEQSHRAERRALGQVLCYGYRVATEYVTCPVCGRSDKVAKMLGDAVEPTSPVFLTREQGGDGKMVWTRGAVPLMVARKMLKLLRRAAASLEAEISAAESAEDSAA